MNTDDELPAFGIVDQNGEHGVLSVDRGYSGWCRLHLVARTERGFPRRELAAIPRGVWRAVAPVVQRELVRGMDPEERGKKEPRFHPGDQALAPLVLRELAVLFFALMEDGAGTHTDALLAGWRQLVREERWWLYARASNPAQKLGHGWRRALFHALTDPADTRNAPRLLEIMETAAAQKKSPLPPPKPVKYRQTPRKRSPRKTAKNAARTMPEKTTKKAPPKRAGKKAVK